MEKSELKFHFDLALFCFGIHKRQTENFTRPLEGYGEDELTDMLGVATDKTLEYIVRNNIIHPKHKPGIKRALPYLAALKEMQKTAWQKRFNSELWATK